VKEAFEKWAAEEVSVKPIDAAGLKQLVANSSENYRLINVWATWCGPCVVEFPELVTINRMYRNRNFEFVSLSADDPDRDQEVLAFLRKQQASNQNFHFSSYDKDELVDALDPDWTAALPHTMFIEPGGEIIYRKTGEVDPLVLKRIIVEKLGRTYD
jgi:thiol-disulfide isomerase/thioredoxin